MTNGDDPSLESENLPQLSLHKKLIISSAQFRLNFGVLAFPRFSGEKIRLKKGLIIS